LEVLNGLVTQAGESVWISEDQGNTFDEVALPVFGGKQEIASALCAPNKDAIYVGTTSGNLYRIDRSAGAWQAPAKLTRPRPGYVSDMCVGAGASPTIWISYSSIPGGGHLYLSTDGGTTWTDRSTKLPMIAVNAVSIDPADANTIYVGTDNGVYK